MNIDYTSLGRILTQSIISANIGVPIAHENAVFDPEAVDAYAEVHTLTSERESYTKQGYGEVFGIYQIDVNVRSGTSTALALDTVTKITDYYVDSLTLESGTTQVIIMNAVREPAQRENGWYTIPVSVSFRARPME